ncbi:Tfp pilus assembly major pilin PilA [Pedobacter sp. W3I1]|nr:Tfp pilus assembly major pilin PilA [Pedobacter sp. W3I1]
MFSKAIGILMILSHVCLKMPLAESKAQKNQVRPASTDSSKVYKITKPALADQTNRQNSICAISLKYTHDRNLVTFAKITIKNKSKQLIKIFSLLLEGDATKGCTKTYEIKRKIELKPNQSVTISQRLVPGDCEFHIVKDLHIKYNINVNFTLD